MTNMAGAYATLEMALRTHLLFTGESHTVSGVCFKIMGAGVGGVHIRQDWPSVDHCVNG